MIQTDLPEGPASLLVRGLAAWLSSTTEVPLAELPDGENLPVRHALASWKSWLADRGFGIVPIADARSFQWAGWWIAVVEGSDSPLAEAPMQLLSGAHALAGRGLDGDRYANSSGTFSPRAAHRPGYDLTLIAAEVVEVFTTSSPISTESHRARASL